MAEIDTRTEAVEALLKDVTPGPWDNQGYHKVATEFGVHGRSGRGICSTGGFQDGNEGTHHENKSNARFIAASRQLVPALLAERDQLCDELDVAYAIIADERGEVINLRKSLVAITKVPSRMTDADEMDRIVRAALEQNGKSNDH